MYFVSMQFLFANMQLQALTYDLISKEKQNFQKN